jgi:uncharacterized protein (TIGR03118 family)
MTLLNRSRALKTAALAAVVVGSLAAQAPNTFLVHNLVSDLPNVADKQDKSLVNPWGNGFGSTPFWIGDNGTGLSTLYAGDGTQNTGVIVNMPGPNGATTGGKVTGVIFNAFSANTAAFALAAGRSPNFMFCTQDGILAGWNPNVDAKNAKVIADNNRSAPPFSGGIGAVHPSYTGCALGGTSAAPLVFMANFAGSRVDVVDGTAALNPGNFANAFANLSIPAGYAPYNVAIINNLVYVTYAKQDASGKNAVFGAGNGYLAVFDQNGNLVRNLILQTALNAPWGLAMAPATFVPFGNDLLVGNLGDGKINAFDPATGALLGTLNDPTGAPIVLEGLWSIAFGSGAQKEDVGTLYFTAGPGKLGTANDPLYSHGLLGSIQAAPSFTTTTILNGGSLLPGPTAVNEWVTLKGSGLSATQVSGTGTTLGGVGVTVGGIAAPLSFVSNSQINFLMPTGVTPGPAPIKVTNNGLASAAVNTTVANLAPSFFTLSTAANGDIFVAATHANGTVLSATSPAAANETIVLYGTGFGAGVVGSSIPVPFIVIDGLPAQVQFAGLIAPGLFQFNVVVPAGITRGVDTLVVAFVGDSVTQVNAFIPVAP